MANTSGIGSPQGTLSGVSGDTYLDTSINKHYICVVSGTSVTAVWLADTKWSQFPSGGATVSTDTLVGLRAGANVRFDANTLLRSTNNLSDVASSSTSLSNIGGQPRTIIGSGDPNGSQAGTAGISFYFDTGGVQLWICTQTGTSSTAVWAIQNQQGGGIDTVNLGFTPTQMLSNKLYIGTIASPSPAIGIMPIAPSPGDVIIIYSAAAAGVTIQKGTASIINVTNNLVSSTIFIPFRNTLVLRCSNSASGGQWFSESIDDTVILDGTTTVGYQPLTIVGSGDPNGVQAGIAGINLYFDTSIGQLWLCTQTGTSSTAVWKIQNESGLQTVNLTTTTPTQMFTNKQYVGSLSSPSPAIGIMPVSPTAGDILVVYSPASQGTTVQIGTASQIEISGNLVLANFFVPQRSSIVLRCFSPASGGQWYAESIDGMITVDGTINVELQPINFTGSGNPNGSFAGRRGINFYFDIVTSDRWQCIATGNSSTAVWDRLVTQNNAFTDHRFYFSAVKGSDISGNGSEEFPFASYVKAAAEASAVATSGNPATVFAMGEETVTGAMSLYPFVNISGYSSNTSRIACSGVISLDSTFDSLANAICVISDVSMSAVSGMNFIFTVSQNQRLAFVNSVISNTPTVNVEGSGGANNEVVIFFNGIIITSDTPATYSLKNVVGAFENWTTSGISMDNDTNINQSILITVNNSTPGVLGAITLLGSSPFQGSILFSANSFLDSLTMNGDSVVTLWDATSYISAITFAGGASFANIINLTLSDGSSTSSLTPLNYTRPPATIFPLNCVTNDLLGIDNALLPVSVNSPDVYADLATFTVNLNTSTNSQLLFLHEVYDPTNSYNSTTCTFTAPRNGRYEFMYDLNINGTGGALNNNYWIDSAFFKNGSFLDSSYCSNRFSDTATGVIRYVNNSGFVVVSLVANDTMNVRAVNNGNINLVIENATFSVKYLGP